MFDPLPEILLNGFPGSGSIADLYNKKMVGPYIKCKYILLFKESNPRIIIDY